MHVHASEQFECIASYASRRSAVGLCSRVSIQKRLACSYAKGIVRAIADT
jgi:hypothetical protein